MPQLMYRHDCGCHQPGWLSGSEAPCSQCAAPAIRHGWHLGMYEAMAQYQRFYGFKAMGEHRASVDALLGPHRARCAACVGAGIVDSSDPAGWRACDACEGHGSVWTSAPNVVDTARAEVASRYPDAVVLTRTPPPTSPMVAFNVRSSTIIDLRDASPPAHDGSWEAPRSERQDGEPAGPDADSSPDTDEEEPEYVRPIRWPPAACMRASTAADVARLVANDAEVDARIALCKDQFLAEQLRRVRMGGFDAEDTAWDLGLGTDWYGVLAMNAWAEDDVKTALAEENGTLWARAAIFEVHDDLTVVVVTLDDGPAVAEVVGVCKDFHEAEWMLGRYGTLIKYEWPE